MWRLLRHFWFRMLLVTVTLVAFVFMYPYVDNYGLRVETAKALQASTLLFAVCTALSLAVLNNYVKGLKDAALKRISDARTTLEKLYDEFYKSDDLDIQEIVNYYILPLLSLATPQWLAFEPLKPILGRIEEPLTRLHERNPSITPRYFLRLEDEINELGILYIRRIVSGLHAGNIEGSFLLVCMGIICIFLTAVLPQSYTYNFVAIAFASATILLAILELLLLLSYVLQEAREELPEHTDDDDLSDS